jgi:hypothetical protein
VAKPRSSRALGVTVEAAFTLEEYDIVSLSATESNGLETWLRRNGYRIPQGASTALKPYINQGMKFFVAKVNIKEQLKTGFTYLRPLQFAFESDKFMLPMRLGMLNAPPGKPQDLIIYVLTRSGRVESSNYRTVKLPANVNLPAFIKPRFQDFYQALFSTAAKTEAHRVVFTEYFWDMSWCDPCAARSTERRGAAQGRGALVAGDRNRGGAQPALLTRLHVRYTPQTFADDLAFTQTKDRQNWQTRYVIQNPYGGSVAECKRARSGYGLRCDVQTACGANSEVIAGESTGVEFKAQGTLRAGPHARLPEQLHGIEAGRHRCGLRLLHPAIARPHRSRETDPRALDGLGSGCDRFDAGARAFEGHSGSEKLAADPARSVKAGDLAAAVVWRSSAKHMARHRPIASTASRRDRCRIDSACTACARRQR